MSKPHVLYHTYRQETCLNCSHAYKTLPARAGTPLVCTVVVAGCNENLTCIKKTHTISCRSVTLLFSEVSLKRYWKEEEQAGHDKEGIK